jgi:hypothetical protein
MKNLFLSILLVLFSFSLNAAVIVPPEILQSSLAEIQNFLQESKPFQGEGAQFGDQFLIEISNEAPAEKIWQMKVTDTASTMVISAPALKKGLTLEQWTNLVSQMYSAHYWMPLSLMIQQQVFSIPNASPAERASFEANALNLLKERLGPKGGGGWDASRAIFDPSDTHSNSHTFFRVYLKSVGPILGDALERRSDDIKDIRARVEVLTAKLEVIFNQMLKEKLDLIQAFNQTQKAPSSFKHTSGTVSELVSLVQKNDREGVAKLLEASLPWDQFTAMETKIYRQFVDSIRRPNKQSSVYLLRGTNPKLDPTPEDLGLMSKLFKAPKFQSMTVNEVFAGYREDWASTAVNRKTDIPFPSFFNLGENHSHSSTSIDGHPSALVSTSASAPVVTKFAKGSKVMMRIDARRIYPNYESMMYFEREVLIPFFIFPDEIEGELVKDEATKKAFIRRAKDQSVNVEATDFLKAHMAKDALALPYIMNIWEKSYQQFFPISINTTTSGVGSVSNLCLGFYRR